MASLLTKLKDRYIAIRGFHTNRKLVVIESDDWGSIRMPSAQIFKKLQKANDHPEKDGFLSNDCLENTKDLENLFQALSSVRDFRGNPAVITANFAMANPDFEKIDYRAGQYAFEPFFKTYEQYYPEENVLDTVKQGIGQGVFFPQLHCREHLNVNRWMKALREQKPDALLAFENKTMGVFASFSPDNPFGYMDAFHTDQTTDRELEIILSDAAALFRHTFGYASKTFVASCFVWADALEKALTEQNIIGIQSASWQNCPVFQKHGPSLKRKIHFTGQKNSRGQIYTVRNCTYEPAYNQNPDTCAANCFNQIAKAFQNKKPAIINSHRFNYISSINPDNAQNNLRGLKKLLNKVTEEFPDVEFITTAELIDIIQGENNE